MPEKDGELLAPYAAYDVATPHGRHSDASEFAQYSVARFMPMAVVHLLKMIKVEHGYTPERALRVDVSNKSFEFQLE